MIAWTRSWRLGIKTIASAIRSRIRTTDILARWEEELQPVTGNAGKQGGLFSEELRPT